MSRQASPFLSLPHQSMCVRIHRLNSRMIICFLARGIDDVPLTAANDSEDFGPSLADALPLSGQEARPSPAYSELVDVLSRAAEKLSHGLDDEPRDSRSSKLDERFLAVCKFQTEFFGDLHQEIFKSWKQPFSSRLTNTAAADFTNLMVSVEQGYTAMPVCAIHRSL